jgi:hypothetical protein
MIEEDILGIDASLNVKISSKKSMKTSQVTQLTNEGIANSRLSSGHSHKISNVTQLTGGGIDCLSKIRRFGEGTMRLSKEDAANILDALNEWDDTIGAKELADNEVGLDYQRWVELKLRLTDFVENKNEFDPPV